MAFSNNFYAMDDGTIIRYRVSTEEAAAVDAASGPATLEFRAYSSGSRKRFGVHTRGLNLGRVVGTVPNQSTRSTFLAIPTLAEYDAITSGDQVDIDGVTWSVTSKSAEKQV